MKYPDKNSVWRHRNGIKYVVIELANTDSSNYKYVPTVVYKNIKTFSVWSRPVEDWHRSFTRVYPDE